MSTPYVSEELWKRHLTGKATTDDEDALILKEIMRRNKQRNEPLW